MKSSNGFTLKFRRGGSSADSASIPNLVVDQQNISGFRAGNASEIPKFAKKIKNSENIPEY